MDVSELIVIDANVLLSGEFKSQSDQFKLRVKLKMYTYEDLIQGCFF